MIEELDPRREDAQYHGMLLGGCVSCNGVDASADRRAHMRELTMARQAAERIYARRSAQPGMDRTAQLAAARQRADDLQAELSRIDEAHREWLRSQGEHVPDSHPRLRK